MTAPLPTLSERTLDRATLDALFAELGTLARVREVRVKGGAGRMAEPGGVSLAEARARLLAGEVAGVQVFYSFEDQSFCDTILAREGAWRVCRMQITG